MSRATSSEEEMMIDPCEDAKLKKDMVLPHWETTLRRPDCVAGVGGFELRCAK
jgi:hypothetical protein